MTARFLAILLAWSLASVGAAKTAAIVAEDSPVLQFAAGEVEQALAAAGYRVSRTGAAALRVPGQESRVIVHFWPVANGLRAEDLGGGMAPASTPPLEGFRLRLARSREQLLIYVIYADRGGALYGGFELAEQIRTAGIGRLRDTDRAPHMSLRGTKFNLPLDLRTPSYSDMSDSAQENIATVWDFEFWREYLDQLARQRYNYVSLWNLHPFPSMVRVPEFPEVALNDVWRTRATLQEDYSTRTTDLLTPAMLAEKEVVLRLSIDQKIAFWRRVMEHARDRNIAFYVVTWNVFTYGVDGKYGITDALDNPRTAAYFRASVRELFRTYPLLAGIGVTAGENMGEVKMYSGGVDAFDVKENWLFATYGRGLLDAAQAEPRRHFGFIHRQHESRAQDIASTFAPLIAQPNVDFMFSFKYAQAHILSSTTQTFHRDYVKSLGSLKTLWTLRNDDALMLRWAAPDFVREFVTNIPHAPSAGYYLGSDMWVWGREFLSKNPRSPRQLENDKHWLHLLLWGRMGYDPSLDNERIAALIGQRFPGIDGARLLRGWQSASMIYPLVTGFHWADFDFQWYIEACRSRPGPAKTASGFHSVESFIHQPVHPGTRNLTIPQFVAGERDGVSPLALAAEVDRRALEASHIARGFLGAIPTSSRDTELGDTLQDILAMAQLGRYYAAKIRGATALAQFRATREPARQREAVAQLTFAQKHWQAYTANMGARYRNPVWTNRVGHVDWRELSAEVAADIAIASATPP